MNIVIVSVGFYDGVNFGVGVYVWFELFNVVLELV